MLSKGMLAFRARFEVDTAPVTGQKSCGLMIRAASMRLDLPHQRVKLHKAIISMHEIARCKERWLPVSILPCQKAAQTTSSGGTARCRTFPTTATARDL